MNVRLPGQTATCQAPEAKGLSYDLPYPDDAFDRVLSSLVFHHMTHKRKVESLHEVRRILKPGGALFIVDFANPRLQSGLRS